MELPPAKYFFAGCGGGGNSGENGDRGWNNVRGGGGGGSSPLVLKDNYVINTEKLFSFTVGNNTQQTVIAIGSNEILVASAGPNGANETPGAGGGGYGASMGQCGGHGTTYLAGLPGGGTQGTYYDTGGGGGGAGSQFPYVIDVGKTVQAQNGYGIRPSNGYGGTGFGAGGGGVHGCYDYNCAGYVSAGAPGAIYIKRYK